MISNYKMQITFLTIFGTLLSAIKGWATIDPVGKVLPHQNDTKYLAINGKFWFYRDQRFI